MAGIKSLGGGTTSDYYTLSSLHSPRIFTIFPIKVISIFSSASPETVISFLGSLIAVLGVPLFIVAAKKRVTGNNFEDINIFEMLVLIVFLTILSMKVMHKIEVNGFYINSFLQGATTSNLSMTIFLMGYVISQKKWKRILYFLSILSHFSTGLFMVLIFYKKPINPFKLRDKKSQHKIFLTTGIFAGFNLAIYIHANLLSWTYYVENRAANHFLITTSNKSILQITLLFLVIMGIIILTASKNPYKYLTLFLLTSLCIFLTSYPLYAVPYALACLCFALKINEKLYVPATLGLLGLFGLQAFPLGIIAVPTSMLLPATRFTSVVTLYLACLLTIEIARITRTMTQRFFKRICSPIQPSKLVSLFLIITITNILTYANQTNEKFLSLKNSIPTVNASTIKARSELIFLDVSSQGWREFANTSIFVDDYPFWGNLEEYRSRNLFRNEILKIALNDQLDPNKIDVLERKFKVNTNIILVTTKENISHLQKFKCNYRQTYYWCDLGII
jgi:hypothetical protein